MTCSIPKGLNLSDEERKTWRSVVRSIGDRLIDADSFALEAFCRNLIRWRRLCAAEQAAVTNGSEFEARRLGRSVSQSSKMLDTSIAMLGLSPKDRKRLSGRTSGKAAKSNPLVAALANRRMNGN